METIGTSNNNTWEKDDNILKYVNSEHTNYNIPWAIVDTIYTSYNILNLRWILVKIDFVARRLLVWNLLRSMTTQLELEDHFKIM